MEKGELLPDELIVRGRRERGREGKRERGSLIGV